MSLDTLLVEPEDVDVEFNGKRQKERAGEVGHGPGRSRTAADVVETSVSTNNTGIVSVDTLPVEPEWPAMMQV